ncbi:unnamed protein product [Strongylus vulgaris]|uniref:Uncharacterized protein n=1 Tax=Strongylus vulgaris TaxID=40348 RepID=A0A3P7KTA2_STRVU|nr:unnamed protein product [Strongylus vulgaris]
MRILKQLMKKMRILKQLSKKMRIPKQFPKRRLLKIENGGISFLLHLMLINYRRGNF